MMQAREHERERLELLERQQQTIDSLRRSDAMLNIHLHTYIHMMQARERERELLELLERQQQTIDALRRDATLHMAQQQLNRPQTPRSMEHSNGNSNGMRGSGAHTPREWMEEPQNRRCVSVSVCMCVHI
jgi:hypothetical protein